MNVRTVLTVLALIAGVVLFMSPLYAMLAMALKTPQELASSGSWEWPRQTTLDNLKAVLTSEEVRFGRLFLNSAIIATLGTLGTILTASLAAYAFARVEFPERDRLFLVMLGTVMLPGVVTIVPTYILFAKIGWVNTQLPLWVPAWLGGGAFNVFLLRQFFKSIPREYDEAARLDGAGHATIFWRVVLPCAGPALATVGTLTFVASWTDFLGPLLYINDRNLMPLELGLRTFQSVRGTQWHLLMAATLITFLPILAIFLVGQRYFIKGITLTSGK